MSAARASATGPADANRYLQVSAGGGDAHDDLRDERIFGLGSVEGTGEGASGMFDPRVGWAGSPGPILGGGLFVEQVTNPKVTVEGRDVGTDVGRHVHALPSDDHLVPEQAGWVSPGWRHRDEWSIGVELRSTGASMYDGDANVRHTWGSGGLLATVVYN